MARLYGHTAWTPGVAQLQWNGFLSVYGSRHCVGGVLSARQAIVTMVAARHASYGLGMILGQVRTAQGALSSDTHRRAHFPLHPPVSTFFPA